MYVCTYYGVEEVTFCVVLPCHFRVRTYVHTQIARTLDQVEETPLDHTSMMVKVLQQRRRGNEQMGVYHDAGGRAGHEGGLVGHYVDKWEGSQVRGRVRIVHMGSRADARTVVEALISGPTVTLSLSFIRMHYWCVCYVSVTLSDVYTVQSIQGFYSQTTLRL